jgi:hypothetical protein
MLPPDAFLGPVLSIAGATLTAVDYGVRLAATDDDLRVSRIVLGTIDNTISHVLSERTRLSCALPSVTQQRIDKILCDAAEVVEIVRKMVNPEGKDEDVGAARRLKWVFKERGTVLSYQSGLLILQSTLLGISAELSQVNAHPPPGYSETFPHADAPGLHASYIIEDLKRWNLLEKPKPAVQGEIQSKGTLSELSFCSDADFTLIWKYCCRIVNPFLHSLGF